MTGEEIEAIVNGYHGDAFRILGPHAVRGKDAQSRWEVRAFLPHADSATVVSGRVSRPMTKKHAQGFFVASLEGDPESYTLHARLWDGRDIEIDDPYRFGPQIADSDLYLHTEGTLYEGWHTLGAHVVQADGISGVRFAVWAPNAECVTLVGEFNAPVKSRQKYWNRPEGGEAILQLRGCVPSEDDRLERFFAQRPGNPHRRKAA